MSIVKRLGGSSAAKIRHLFGLCKDFEEKMCKVSAKKQVYLFFLPSRSHFYAKSVEMEVIFNRCWVLEIQNEVSTNQIGWSEGLDVTLDKVSCTSAMFKRVWHCSRFALPLRRNHEHMRGQTAKWKLVFDEVWLHERWDCATFVVSMSAGRVLKSLMVKRVREEKDFGTMNF